MSFQQLDLKSIAGSDRDDPNGLTTACAGLFLGQPFRFARVSYGEELTLHFGKVEPARSPKLRGLAYGSVILGLRASNWWLRSSSTSTVIQNRELSESIAAGTLKPISKEDLESREWIAAGSVVVSVEALDIPSSAPYAEGIGLSLAFSDGSALFIAPASTGAMEAGDADLPPVADMELLAPQGLLRVGPGRRWSYQPLDRAAERA